MKIQKHTFSTFYLSAHVLDDMWSHVLHVVWHHHHNFSATATLIIDTVCGRGFWPTGLANTLIWYVINKQRIFDMKYSSEIRFLFLWYDLVVMEILGYLFDKICQEITWVVYKQKHIQIVLQSLNLKVPMEYAVCTFQVPVWKCQWQFLFQ